MRLAIVCAAGLLVFACGKTEQQNAKQYKVVGISYCDDLGTFKQPVYMLYKVGELSDGGGLDGVGKNVFGRENVVTDSPLHLTIVTCPEDADVSGVDFRALASELDKLPRPPICDRQKVVVAETIEARKSADLRHEKYDGVLRWPELEGVQCATGKLVRAD